MYREYFEALRKNNKKVAIVTGSSRGIGFETSLTLSRNGWILHLCYNAQPLQI